MRIIKNSHAGIGGIATESVEMLRYFGEHPEHHLSLVHRDVNEEKYFVRSSSNTSTHYLVVDKRRTDEFFRGLDSKQAFYEKYNGFVSRMREIIDSEKPDISFCSGSFYYPWLLLQASIEKNLPISVIFAGIMEKETEEPLALELGADFINPDYLYIFPSELARRTIEEIHDVSLPHSYISPNGINPVFFEKRIREPSDDFNIAFVGRIHKVKNPEYCATLSSALKQEGVRASIFCVTDLAELDASNPYHKNVMDQLNQQGVRFLDSRFGEDLADFYNSCDLIITPSHFETFGNVPLEAIATGTPALVHKEVGVKGVLTELGLGDLVLDFRDVDSVVRKVKEIKRERRVIDPIVTQKIAEDYNWDSIIENNLSILDSYLGEINKRAAVS